MTFEVWGDGKKLFDSGMLLGRDAAKTAKLDVKGVQKLKLVTTVPATAATAIMATGRTQRFHSQRSST